MSELKLTKNQRMLKAALESGDADIVGVFGPSGTGKSFVVLMHGIEQLEKGRYRRIVLVRPLVSLPDSRVLSSVETGEQYYRLVSRYLYDILEEHVGRERLDELIRSGKIAIVDPNFLSGRTFEHSLVFLDDAQYAHPSVLPELLLRMGEGSKLAIAGDPILQVFPGEEKNTAAIARELLFGEENAIIIDMGVNDLVRPGSRKGFKLALEMRLRRRVMSEEEKRVYMVASSHAPDADIITVVWLKDLKEKYGLETPPDALIIVKEDTLSRLIGRRGERINRVEKDTGLSLRGIELTMDLSNLVKAIHPVGWMRKHIVSAELVGTNLVVYVNPEEYGAFIGKGGVHIRFLDEAFQRMLGIGIRGRHARESREKR